jgi:periplasmic copper chaperone A
MKRVFFIVFVLLIVSLAACSSGSTESGEMVIENVQANMAMPSDTGSVWVKITNNTGQDDALIGADLAGCGAIELHNMVMDGDVMVMRQVEGGEIPIPNGETVELKQGGLHIMCIGKEAPLELGTSVDIGLNFANAGTINVTGTVVEPGGMMDMEQGDGGMEMDN